jgi:hypothetical protein
MAIRFDRPLEGQYSSSLWLPCSLSTQAGRKHFLNVARLYLRVKFALGAIWFRGRPRLRRTPQRHR